MLKHGILGLLNYGDMTGYEIREVFRDSLNFFWTAQSSQIYRELHGLEDRGLIRMRSVEQSGRPDKKVCAITPAGREELLRWLRQDPIGPEARMPVLMKTFFLGELSREEGLRFFREQEEGSLAALAALEQTDRLVGAYQAQIAAPDKALYWQMTADFGRRYAQMYLEWTRECARKLREEGS